MDRRGFLALVVVGVAGCLGRSAEPAADDAVGPEVVEYEVLSDRGKRFVAEARRSGHTVHWIRRDGETIHVEYDSDREEWVLDQDPLTLESVDEELKEVFQRGAYLEIEERYYERRLLTGHGPYRMEFTATPVTDCAETIDPGTLAAGTRTLIGLVVEQERIWVADRPAFEPIANADAVFDDEDVRAEFIDTVVVPDDVCVAWTDQTYQIQQTDQDNLASAGYELVYADHQP